MQRPISQPRSGLWRRSIEAERARRPGAGPESRMSSSSCARCSLTDMWRRTSQFHRAPKWNRLCATYWSAPHTATYVVHHICSGTGNGKQPSLTAGWRLAGAQPASGGIPLISILWFGPCGAFFRPGRLIQKPARAAAVNHSTGNTLFRIHQFCFRLIDSLKAAPPNLQP